MNECKVIKMPVAYKKRAKKFRVVRGSEFNSCGEEQKFFDVYYPNGYKFCRVWTKRSLNKILEVTQ